MSLRILWEERLGLSGHTTSAATRKGPATPGASKGWRAFLRAFGQDRSGATAVEYGLICALIFLVIVTSVTAFGNKTTNIINTVSAAITAAIGP